MKKLLVTTALVAMSVAAFAQDSDFKARYDRQVRNVGYDGVGVETIIDKWEAAEPTNADMLLARYQYYLARARYTEVVPKYQNKFMGSSPTVVLKDENGMDVGYFEEIFFDDEPFGQAQKVLDKLISLYPDEISYRYEKISSLISYEKEFPEMATKELNNLISLNETKHPTWKYKGEDLTKDDYLDAIQEFCYTYFTIGSAVSMNSFMDISVKMSKYYPKYTVFLSNQGTYWLVGGNSGKALKSYAQVLKIDPKDYSAVRNTILIARRNKDTKLEMKYLPVLIEITESDTERLSAQGRMQALSNAKKKNK